mgnify:CR=1 FL=1
MSDASQSGASAVGRNLGEHFRALSQKILRLDLNARREEFLREALDILVDFASCDAAEIQLVEGSTRFRAEVKRGDPQYFLFESRRSSESCKGAPGQRLYASCAAIPLSVGGKDIGSLYLKSSQPDRFAAQEIEMYKDIAQTLSIVIAHRRSNALLRERVKELTCLYGIASIVARPDASLPEILKHIVELLPPAWLYPEIASARIVLDGQVFKTDRFHEGVQHLRADIFTSSRSRGLVEVSYALPMSERDEGPFLKEERSLIDTIAHELAIIIERKEAEEEKGRLQEQLRHADRLATIGQLAAGVAHELNEPLCNILGFAQLILKSPGMPEQERRDIDKIAAASLHAREVIRKLMLFARQVPHTRTAVDLNRVVREGMTFLEARCARADIRTELRLEPDLPEIIADPAQMTQVLVNLVVNAIQALPKGGRLAIQTSSTENHVFLLVEDNGIGMSREVLNQIFIPFFTTKDVNQGTGLGLSVIHGIVNAHGGSIKVDSAPGQGSRFEILLPRNNTN